MANWQENIQIPLKLHLQKVIKNSAEHRNSISLANDKKTAQLWIAISQLSKDLHESKTRIKYLENILIDVLETKKKQAKTKKKKTEINNLIKTLKNF